MIDIWFNLTVPEVDEQGAPFKAQPIMVRIAKGVPGDPRRTSRGSNAAE